MTTPDDDLHARIDRPSGEIERPASSARLPGAPRDGYATMPTGPVDIERIVATGPHLETDDSSDAGWLPGDTPVRGGDARVASWALVAAIVALCASFFVAWGLPVAITAVIASIVSLRRPTESRAMARWALVLGLTATAYSLGWLVWAGLQFERLG
ncbi:MAG: hypothetical protein QM630_05005 [Microbacterium sp.]